jgi:hypothetical protein
MCTACGLWATLSQLDFNPLDITWKASPSSYNQLYRCVTPWATKIMPIWTFRSAYCVPCLKHEHKVYNHLYDERKQIKILPQKVSLGHISHCACIITMDRLTLCAAHMHLLGAYIYFWMSNGIDVTNIHIKYSCIFKHSTLEILLKYMYYPYA